MKENKADYLTTVNVSIISSSTKGGMSGRGASGESNENAPAFGGCWLDPARARSLWLSGLLGTLGHGWVYTNYTVVALLNLFILIYLVVQCSLSNCNYAHCPRRDPGRVQQVPGRRRSPGGRCAQRPRRRQSV